MATRQSSLAMIMIIALAFATSTMTALRIPGIPLGAAELILIACMVVHLPLGHGVHGHNVPNRFVPALFLLLLAMLPGYLVTLVNQGVVPYAMYNLVATVWVVLLFAYLHFGFDHSRGEIDLLVRGFLFFSTLYFVILLLLWAFEPSTVYLQDDYELLAAADVQEDGLIFRLVGFSTNPNQLALHALVASFFALVQWRRNGLLASVLALGTALACGLLAKSDAFLFSTIALIGTWIVMGIVYHRAYILGLVVVVPGVAALLVLLPRIVNQLQEIASTGGQDATRFTLWENGILAGLQRPFVGFGPGNWSGFDGPFGLEEAHNSAIDYFSNAGLIGATLLVLAMLALLFRALRSGNAAMVGGCVAVMLFAMFHNVLRQPIMWLGLYVVAQSVWAGQQQQQPERSRSRRRRRSGAPSSRGLEF